MSSPFDLPRADCAYVPTVDEISDCAMMPKPKWAGAADYCDPNYPSGAGPDDVPPAPPPFGEATPPTVSPPAQTSMGGGGGGPGRDFEKYVFENGGDVAVVKGDLMKPSGCVGWSIEESCYLLELNDINSNLVLFVCIDASVAPGATGDCYCLAGRTYQKTYAPETLMPDVYESLGSDTGGQLTRHLLGFRCVAIEGYTVHYTRDIMPSQIIRVTNIAGTNVTAQTIVDPTGTLGGEDIPGTRTTT